MQKKINFFLRVNKRNKFNKPCVDVLKYVFFIIATTMILPLEPVKAANKNKPLGHINQYLRINGDFLSSYEYWDYFRPEPAVNNNNSYNLWILRARVGAMLTTTYVDGFVQAQYSGLYGLPDNAVASPGGPLGLGAGYFLTNNSTNVSNIFLKQGFLNFKFAAFGLPGATLKVGRFDQMEGMEYHSGINKFDGLKRRRISQRLIGGFNAIYVGRSFDGFTSAYDRPSFNLTVSGTRPTQGGLNIHGQKQIKDINVLYTAFTSKKDALIPGTEGRLFYMNYDDQRNTQVLDNRSYDERPLLNNEKLNIHTIGAHLLSLHPIKSGSIDTLVWGAYQFGEWTNQSHQAWAIAAEVGYQWYDVTFKPWLRAVYYRSSGDSNAQDGRHTTYFSALPSGRVYAKFPFYNLMNIQDMFVEIIASPTANTQIHINLHQLSMANSGDLLYGGLGATSSSGAFGYTEKSADGNRDIGQLVDIGFTHKINEKFSWGMYYGHAFGGSAMKNIYQGKSSANSFLVDFNMSF